MATVTTNYVIRQIFEAVTGKAESDINRYAAGCTKVATSAASATPPVAAMAAAAATGGATAASSIAAIPVALNAAGNAAGRFEGEARGSFGRVSTMAGSMIARIGGIAAAFIGIQQAMRAIGGAISGQVDLESTQLSMAAMINANFDLGGAQGAEKFAAALGVANGYVMDLARASASLPGEFADFVAVSQAIAGPLFAANQGLDQLLTKTGSIATLAAMMPAGTRTIDVGSQVSRMLQGQAGADNPVAMFLKSTGLLKTSFEDFNKLSGPEKVRQTFEAIGKLTDNPAILDAIARSAAVQFSTLKDNVFGVIGLLGSAGKVIKEELVVQARRLNEWFEKHRDQVKAWGEALGNSVVPMITRAGDLLVYAVGHMKELKNTAVAVGAAIATWQIASLSAAGAGAMVGGAAAGAVGLAGVSGAAVAAGLSNTLRVGLLGTIFLIPGLIASIFSRQVGGDMLRFAFAPMLPFLTRIGAVLPAIASGLGILGFIVAVVAGGMMVVRNNLFGLGDMFSGSMGRLGASFMRLGASLGGMFTALAIPLGTVIIPAVSVLADLLAVAIDLLNKLINHAGGVVAGMSQFWGTFFTNGNPFAAFDAAKEAYSKFEFKNVADYYKQNAAAQGPAKGSAATSMTNNTFNGPITLEMKFEKDVSPDRIAVGTLEEFKKLAGRRPKLRPLAGY